MNDTLGDANSDETELRLQLGQELDAMIENHGPVAARRALRLTPALVKFRDESEHAFEMGIAAIAEGFGGNLVIQAARKYGEPTEVMFSSLRLVPQATFLAR